MSKKRRVHGAVVVAMLAAVTVLASTTASAQPAKKQETVKLGFITKFPVDFYFTLVKAAKKWDKATPGAQVIFAERQERHGRCGRDRRDPEHDRPGRQGHRDHTDEPRGRPRRSTRRSRPGSRSCSSTTTSLSWKKKSSVVATNNLKGGELAGKYLATKLKAGDTLGILEGSPAATRRWSSA